LDVGVICGLHSAGCLEVQWRKGQVRCLRRFWFGYCRLFRVTVEKGAFGKVAYFVDWILLAVFWYSGKRDRWDCVVVCGLYFAGCVEVQWKEGQVGGCSILWFGYCWLCSRTVGRRRVGWWRSS
jgi:hypothetical protein